MTLLGDGKSRAKVLVVHPPDARPTERGGDDGRPSPSSPAAGGDRPRPRAASSRRMIARRSRHPPARCAPAARETIAAARRRRPGGDRRAARVQAAKQQRPRAAEHRAGQAGGTSVAKLSGGIGGDLVPAWRHPGRAEAHLQLIDDAAERRRRAAAEEGVAARRRHRRSPPVRAPAVAKRLGNIYTAISARASALGPARDVDAAGGAGDRPATPGYDPDAAAGDLMGGGRRLSGFASRPVQMQSTWSPPAPSTRSASPTRRGARSQRPRPPQLVPTTTASIG